MTIETISDSYLGLFLLVTDWTLSTILYQKRDDFDFRIVNYHDICSNIPESPAYGVYISQLRLVMDCIHVCFKCFLFVYQKRLRKIFKMSLSQLLTAYIHLKTKLSKN